jgi:hypothetical protein
MLKNKQPMTNLTKSITLAMLICFMACQSPQEQITEEAIAEEEPVAEESAWIMLFDGTDASAWRSFNGDSLPDGWIIEEGTLKSLGKGGDIGGDIVYGAREFGDFELALEWKISEGGNSGIFYHVKEGEEYPAPYYNAPEYQIVDDLNFPEPLEEWQKLGADYAMYTADPAKKIVKPAGEWNTSRIIFTENRAEYWLNGEMVLSFDPWSEEWTELKETGKWMEYPDYGKYKTGLIGLQDHGSEIWFKNIRIKEL